MNRYFRAFDNTMNCYYTWVTQTNIVPKLKSNCCWVELTQKEFVNFINSHTEVGSPPPYVIEKMESLVKEFEVDPMEEIRRLCK